MNQNIEQIIRNSVSYNPEEGTAFWKYNASRSNIWNAKYPGKIVGGLFTSEHGMQYYRTKIAGHGLLVHRIDWFIMTGDWPEMIDHKDGNGLNNKWNNLREATQAQNFANRGNPLRGIDPFPNGKWRAKICIDRQQIHLGMFDTKEAAYTAYQEALIKEHGEYAISNRRLLLPNQ